MIVEYFSNRSNNGKYLDRWKDDSNKKKFKKIHYAEYSVNLNEHFEHNIFFIIGIFESN